MASYYSISIKPGETIPPKLFRQVEKNELFLSAHGLLAGFNRMAMLESRGLATKFMEAYMPRLQKRYGENIVVSVDVWRSSKLSKSDLKRIECDSNMAKKRLETGVLAANVRPA